MENKVPEEKQPADQMSDPSGLDKVALDFEQAIAQADEQHYCLRLYIAGTTSRSMSALQRLKVICETYLQGRYELEVIDVYQTSPTVLTDNVVAIPTLIKQLPLPLRRVIGDLSDTEKVLLGLDLVPK